MIPANITEALGPLDLRPAPPVPADADLRHFATMPLHVQRLRDSELATQPDAEVRWANLMSWCAAWHQRPAGSLPDDDAALCRLLGYGRDLRLWRRLRAKGALRGWYEANDGRLYHPVVASMTLECLAKSRAQSRNARARWDGQVADNPQIPECHGNAGAQTLAMPKKGREGIRVETLSLSSPNGEERERESPADAADALPLSVKRKPPEIPQAVLFDMLAIWNEAVVGVLPQVSELSAKRAQRLRARIAERWAKDPIGKWRTYIAAILASSFLRGENDRGWRANFDWAIRPDSPVSVAEGKYRDSMEDE